MSYVLVLGLGFGCVFYAVTEVVIGAMIGEFTDDDHS